MNLPPTFSFDGDIDKSISLKSQARQFYNNCVLQAEVASIPTISRSLPLPDGSLISVYSYLDGVYNNRLGSISIKTAPDINKKLEEQDKIFLSIEDNSSPPVSGAISNPGYRTFTQSLVYKNLDTILHKSAFNILGKRLYSISDPNISIKGGQWFGGLDEDFPKIMDSVISYSGRELDTYTSFAISGDLKVVIGLNITNVLAVSLLKVGKISDIYPIATSYNKVVLVIKSTGSIGSVEIAYYGLLDSSDSLTLIGSYTKSLSISSDIERVVISNDSKKIAITNKPLIGGVTLQKVVIGEFNTDYSDITLSTIYSEIPQYKTTYNSENTIRVPDNDYDVLTSYSSVLSSTSSKAGGVPIILDLKYEENKLYALRYDVLSLNSSLNSSRSLTDYTSNSTSSHSYKCEVIYLEATGYTSILSTPIATSVGNSDYYVIDGNASSSTSSTSSYIYIIGFSGINKLILYKNHDREYTYTHTLDSNITDLYEALEVNLRLTHGTIPSTLDNLSSNFSESGHNDNDPNVPPFFPSSSGSSSESAYIDASYILNHSTSNSSFTHKYLLCCYSLEHINNNPYIYKHGSIVLNMKDKKYKKYNYRMDNSSSTFNSGTLPVSITTLK